MLPHPFLRSGLSIVKPLDMPNNRSPFPSLLSTLVSSHAGLLAGLFVTVVIIAGECAMSCSSVQVSPPAVAFVAATIGCAMALVYGVAKRSRAGYLWCQALGWLSGASAYFVAYALKFYA